MLYGKSQHSPTTKLFKVLGNPTRIFIDGCLFLAALFLPWWLVLSCASGAFFLFDRFLEILLVGFFMDLLYAAPRGLFSSFQFMTSLLAIAIFLALSFIKRRTRF